MKYILTNKWIALNCGLHIFDKGQNVYITNPIFRRHFNESYSRGTMRWSSLWSLLDPYIESWRLRKLHESAHWVFIWDGQGHSSTLRSLTLWVFFNNVRFIQFLQGLFFLEAGRFYWLFVCFIVTYLNDGRFGHLP